MPKLQQRPFSITIFVPDGDPDSLRFVEKSNWTGIGVVFNRMNNLNTSSLRLRAFACPIMNLAPSRKVAKLESVRSEMAA